MNRKGFTLIELLVVVAVLALLASIVFSNLGGAREGARISNALSFQSQTHSLLGSDLVGWWNFDDSGDRYKDISGYDNHGSCTSCPIATDGVPGTLGSAMDFDGATNYISIAHSDFLSDKVFGVSEIFTISSWAYPKSWTSYSTIINKATGTSWSNTTNGLWIYSGGFRCVMGANVGGNPSGSSISVTYQPTLNDWYQVSCSADGDRLRMFVNGEEIGSSNISGLTYERSSNTEPITIGRRCVGCNESFNGIIDDLRLYSRALTASEVQTLYAQTKDNYLANE